MKTASSRASRLHSDGMNAEIKASTRCFDERSDFSLRLYLYHLSEITVLHETTQNLRLKNEILCLTFAFREQIRAMADAFSLTTAMRFLRSESERVDRHLIPPHIFSP